MTKLLLILLCLPMIGFGQTQLEILSNNLNKSCPLKFDEYTTWVNTKVIDGALIYNYSISKTKLLKDYNITVQDWGDYKVAEMTTYYCTASDHRYFRDNNITCVVIYSDLNGRIVKEFEVNNNACD
jgi:hypothetical protein